MRRLPILVTAFWLTFAGMARAEVAVYVPGAMTEAMQAIADAADAADIPFTVVGGHSPAQARQIAEGAPADIFVSADPQWTEFLRGKGLLDQPSEAVLVSTRLVLITSTTATLTYHASPGESLAAQLDGGRLAVGDPETVPAGRFARQALTRLGSWNEVENRLAPLPNVRAVVAMVARGEVPAGIGYASDVAGEPSVRIAAVFPPEAAPPITFPIAIVAGHRNAEVTKVHAFIRGRAALTILRRHGFLTP